LNVQYIRACNMWVYVISYFSC